MISIPRHPSESGCQQVSLSLVVGSHTHHLHLHVWFYILSSAEAWDMMKDHFYKAANTALQGLKRSITFTIKISLSLSLSLSLTHTHTHTNTCLWQHNSHNCEQKSSFFREAEVGASTLKNSLRFRIQMSDMASPMSSIYFWSALITNNQPPSR
jgi:hypothetical protein